MPTKVIKEIEKTLRNIFFPKSVYCLNVSLVYIIYY